MKKTILTIVALIYILPIIEGKVFYVKQDGSGNATSWKNASGDLAAVLFCTRPGDEIWVAKGTYYPTCDMDREQYFNIPSGIQVLGGFIGQETQKEDRDFLLHVTKLSGDIGIKNIFSDNSFTVVYMENADELTLLDGFVIADGTSDGTSSQGDLDRSGAGLYINGKNGGNCRPVVQNCIFQNNYARDGGAAYLNGTQGKCNPSFIACKFYSNKVDLDGGALYNDGKQEGDASPALMNCEFKCNSGNYGAAICNYGVKGKSCPMLVNCIFENNNPYIKGGVIFSIGAGGKAYPIVNNCSFKDNNPSNDNIVGFGQELNNDRVINN